MVLIFVLAFIKEAVLLDQNSTYSSEDRIPELRENVPGRSETERIQQSAALQRSAQNFCTIDGLFCVPSNYSKYEHVLLRDERSSV